MNERQKYSVYDHCYKVLNVATGYIVMDVCKHMVHIGSSRIVHNPPHQVIVYIMYIEVGI